MGELTFLQLAERVLREENRPLAPSEIWKAGVAKGYSKQLRSQGKTPSNTLYATIFGESKLPHSQFIKVSERPARYFLKSLIGEAGPSEVAAKAAHAPVIPERYRYRESHLHPFLARFVRTHFNAQTKTIRHSTSGRGEYGEWVHPDMIGVFYPDWRDEVRELGRAIGGYDVKLYSFELKRSLSFANLREAFFQAVSNSSFAHEGYLVAADIATDEDFRGELRRLSTSFGIGIIELDIEEPDSSRVLVPAREKEALNWDALDKLAMNPDVQNLLKRIRSDLMTGEVRSELYDKVLSPEELVASIPRGE